MELLFLPPDGPQIIPDDLLLAISGFEGFKIDHFRYWRKYGGQYGFCTYQSAFDYLEEDLKDHNLPVRYSSFDSYDAYKRKMRRRK